MRLPIQVECIIYRRVDSKIEYLLLKRIPDKGGFWQAVTGGFEEEDTLIIETCKREVLEETGITEENIIEIKENVHFFQFETVDFSERSGSMILSEYVYGVEVKPEVNVIIDKNVYPEHSEFKWVSFDEAIKLLKHQNNKKAFTKLNKLIS